MILLYFFFFFFFQAEDGIRDHCVTGVQTCALPILPRAPGIRVQHVQVMAVERATRQPDFLLRSEERRVGKECRSRWSPYHEKKNKERHGSTEAIRGASEDWPTRETGDRRADGGWRA